MTWEFACTRSALLRSIEGCWLAWEEKSGSGDTIRPLAEKALFSTLAGKFTQKNLGQGFKSGRRQEMLCTWDPRIFVLDDFPHFMWERCAVGRFARADLRVSRVRGIAPYKFVH